MRHKREALMTRRSESRMRGGPSALHARLLATAIIFFFHWGAALGQVGSKLYVTNSNSHTVVEFPAATTGNVTPIVTIAGPATGLFSPSAVAVDSAGRIYVANFAGGPAGTGNLNIYSASSHGNSSP